MTVLDVNLDDRTFQGLVSEARTRITQLCPEWTEHNVSDPGITLIELFSWLTDLTIYRLNRVPTKVHLALLELLGVQLAGPSPATTDVRFLVAQGNEELVTIPSATEVTTLRTASEEPVVFQVRDEFSIRPMRPSAVVLERSGQYTDLGLTHGVSRPAGRDQLAFSTPPVVGDAVYIGFDHPLDRLILQVTVEASRARGAGVEPDDPPLLWEVAQADGTWLAADVLVDQTGGFNFGSGQVEMQCPPTSARLRIGDEHRYWVRCRIDARTRTGRVGGAYTHAPELYSLTGRPIGAVLPASHATHVHAETVGISDGTPAQTFRLRMSPVLAPDNAETVEVQHPDVVGWEPWQHVDSFADSGPADPHFRIVALTGEVQFGPAVRQADGSWRQHGAIPPKDAVLRMTSYRTGGGHAGNVQAGRLSILRAAIPGIASVTNLHPALGGVDAETLEMARTRTPLEIRTRYRAVTSRDFVILAHEASLRVARATCEPPGRDEPVILRVLPQIERADRKLAYRELIPDEDLLRDVGNYLDERRLLGTTIEVRPMLLRWLSVVVEIQTAPWSDPARVEEDVAHALYSFLNPIVGGTPTGLGSGWPVGRPVSAGELHGIVNAVDGVEYASTLRMFETGPRMSGGPKDVGTQLALGPFEVVASAEHTIRATRRRGA